MLDLLGFLTGRSQHFAATVSTKSIALGARAAEIGGVEQTTDGRMTTFVEPWSAVGRTEL
jgi:hypothetical protein